MKLTTKQQNELVVWQYFMPKNIKWEEETEEDITKFFEWSQEGKHKERSGSLSGELDTSYFNALREGKKWAGIHMQIYEEGVLDLSMPYVVILGGYTDEDPAPREVVDFMKKEMFKGTDAKIIEDCYEQILLSKKLE